MDDMTDLSIGDAMVWRRLEAYAETRLSPDLTASSRLRARVLAVAHRQAALARADAALTVVPQSGRPSLAPTFSPLAQQLARNSGARPRRRHWQRAGAVLLAASLALGAGVGGAFAARPGGPLYETRLWAETITLPTDPSARALAELERLQERLREIGEASRAGDAAAATAALTAYENIVDDASAAAILAHDDVATAVLETGVKHNVAVLQALIARAPAQAKVAISRAVDAAIARSTAAVERIQASRLAGGPGNGAGGGRPTVEPTPRATKAPAAKPTPKPTVAATPRPKPTAKPTAEPTPEPEATPARTPKPKPEPPGRPDDGGGLKTQGKPSP